MLAFVFTKGGRVLFPYKHLNFPFLTVRNEQVVPDGSLLKRRGAREGIASDVCECVPDIWINVERESQRRIYTSRFLDSAMILQF